MHKSFIGKAITPVYEPLQKYLDQYTVKYEVFLQTTVFT